MNPNQPHSLPPAYFDEVYRANEDPWGFETSPYEREKYAATLAALPRAHYARAFEIGCSLGVLTEQLAGRCGHLLAVDVADAPLQRARQRCAHLPQVVFERLRVPEEFPAPAAFDLIVVSEVGYYWSVRRFNPNRRLVASRFGAWGAIIAGALDAGGTRLSAHGRRGA